MVWSRTSSESSDCEGVVGVASSARRSICETVYLLVVIVCSRGLLYATCRSAFSWSLADCRRGEIGDFVVVKGGRGEFRRMLRRLRGCVYGSLERCEGRVVRRRAPLGVIGVCNVLTRWAATGVVALSKFWGWDCSTADMGGVAFMVMELGKRCSFAATAVTT